MANKPPPSIGVDLGGTNISAGVVNHKNDVIGRAKNKTKAEEGPDTVIKRILKTVDEACEDAGVQRSDAAALGIGAPGAIDIEKGLVINAVNLRWTNLPLADILAKELSVPVVVDNDVNVGAWGEFRAGAGKDFDDLLAVFVGTGIGGGLVLGGRLYHGACHTAGEIGHTVLLTGGVRGRRTLENCASRTASVNLLRELMLANHDSALYEIVDGDLDSIRSKSLAKAVKADDPLVLEVMKDSAVFVGVAIANVVTLLSLPCVVLGGGVTEALEGRYVGWVRESFEEHVFPSELKSCKVLASELGDDAGIVGAALLAAERVNEAG